MPEIKGGKSTNWLSVILIENIKHEKINEIILNFEEQNIEIRPVWKPMHLQPLFKNVPFYHKKNEAISKYLFNQGLCLPSGSNLAKYEIDRIIKLLKDQIYPQWEIKYVHLLLIKTQKRSITNSKY